MEEQDMEGASFQPLDNTGNKSSGSRPQQQQRQEEQQPAAGDDQSPSPKRTRWGGDDEDDDDRSRVHVDLQPQQQALPYGWEQFLDINTGEVYYIDWSTCKRTCRDPREVARLADDKIRALRQVRSFQQQEQEQEHGVVSRSHTSSARPAAGAAPSFSSSSSASAVFPPQPYHPSSEDEEQDHQNEASSSQAQRRGGRGHENVMVALGCHRCLTYFMLPRQDPVCPSCGARLQIGFHSFCLFLPNSMLRSLPWETPVTRDIIRHTQTHAHF
ncbi:hypothetical protein SELMODRAFT_407630 [Selaginella moellendorffii]|uniref:WW domain-containing protein n=1 Tax=Selaginella moellendorffii TaxID=88036 RepID=D8R683_SELML|nr:hypothetical protein SELMODRAFT_407630 [Selaginella moellendorffii]